MASYLKKEDADYLLLETSDRIILQEGSSPSASVSPSASISPSASASASQSPSASVSPSVSPSASQSPSSSGSPSPSSSASTSPSISPSASFSPSTSPSSSHSPSSSLSRSQSPSKSPSPSVSKSSSSSVSRSPSASISISASPSPSPSPAIPGLLYTREANGTLPTTTADLSTIYSTIEENDVFARDSRYVDLSGAAGAYLLHLFKKINDNREDIIKIYIALKSSLAPSSSPVYLQIWNGTTLTWETLDTNNTHAADTALSLDATVLLGASNYYDFANQVAIRVYQLNNAAGAKTLSIDQTRISFIVPFNGVYSDTGNNYSQIYPEVTTDYVDSY